MTSQHPNIKHDCLTHMSILIFLPFKWDSEISYFMRIETRYTTECPLTVS